MEVRSQISIAKVNEQGARLNFEVQKFMRDTVAAMEHQIASTLGQLTNEVKNLSQQVFEPLTRANVDMDFVIRQSKIFRDRLKVEEDQAANFQKAVQSMDSNLVVEGTHKQWLLD